MIVRIFLFVDDLRSNMTLVISDDDTVVGNHDIHGTVGRARLMTNGCQSNLHSAKIRML